MSRISVTTSGDIDIQHVATTVHQGMLQGTPISFVDAAAYPIPNILVMYYGGLSLPFIGTKDSLRELDTYNDIQGMQTEAIFRTIKEIYMEMRGLNPRIVWPNELTRIKKIDAWCSCVLVLTERGELPNDEMNGICPFENVPRDMLWLF